MFFLLASNIFCSYKLIMRLEIVDFVLIRSDKKIKAENTFTNDIFLYIVLAL